PPPPPPIPYTTLFRSGCPTGVPPPSARSRRDDLHAHPRHDARRAGARPARPRRCPRLRLRRGRGRRPRGEGAVLPTRRRAAGQARLLLALVAPGARRPAVDPAALLVSGLRRPAAVLRG